MASKISFNNVLNPWLEKIAMGAAKSKLGAGNWDEGSRFELKKFEDLSGALL